MLLWHATRSNSGVPAVVSTWESTSTTLSTPLNSPYARSFHPGTSDQRAATVIESTGKPGVVT